MNYPKISIIMPSYRQGKFIEEAILSVINQNYPNTEIIIIDGGSDDETIEIIKKYEKNIYYWVSEKDNGQSDAINKGINKSTGDIIFILSTDDIIVPETFFKVIDLFHNSNETTGVIFGKVIFFEDSRDIRTMPDFHHISIEKYLSSIAFSFSSGFIKRKYLELVGTYDVTLHYGMDFDFFSRLALVCNFLPSNEIFVRYRFHPESKSINQEKYFVEDWILIFVNLVKNLKLKFILNELIEIDNFKKYFYVSKPFLFTPINNIVDEKQMLYFFLEEVFNADYRNCNFSRADSIGKYLKSVYPKELENSHELNRTIQRLEKIPRFLIRFFRKIKKVYSKSIWYLLFAAQNIKMSLFVKQSVSKPKLKVAFILSHINNSLQWSWFVEEIKKKQIQHIFIIISSYKPLLMTDVENMGSKVYLIEHRRFTFLFINFYHIVNFFKICKILLSEKINVVQTELPYGNLLGLSSAWVCNIKNRIMMSSNVTWAHDYNSNKQKIIDKISYFLAKKIVAQTDISNEYLNEKFNISKKKIFTIWHGIKMEEYEKTNLIDINRLKHQYNVSDSDFIIGMIARLEEWKGHIYVIKAVKKLIDKYPDIKLLIFGKGPLEQQYMNFIQEQNLQKNIFLMGFTSEILLLYKIFNIHIHVPINKNVETFGLNIIEGMASGCPQILTKSGIAVSTAKHLYNCLIVDYCNSDQIADAIEKLKNDPQLMASLGEHAKNDVKELFSIKRKVEEHIKLYNL